MVKPFKLYFYYFFPIFLSIMAAAVGLALFIKIEQNNLLENTAEKQAETIREKILKEFDDHLSGFNKIGRKLLFQEMTKMQWQAEAKFLLANQSLLKSIIMVDEHNQLAWTVGETLSLYPSLILNKNLLRKLKESSAEQLSLGVYDETGHMVGIALYLPLSIEKTFSGYMIEILDLEQFFIKAHLLAAHDQFSLTIRYNGETILQQGSQYPVYVSVEKSVDLLGLTFDIVVDVSKNLLTKNEIYLPWAVIFLGAAFAFLLSLLTYYYREAKISLQQCQKISKDLDLVNHMFLQQDRLVSLGTLTAGVVHEVKNPINIIKSFSELSEELIIEINQRLKGYEPNFSVEDKEELNQSFGILQANVVRIAEQSVRADNIIQRILAHARGNKTATSIDIHQLMDEYLNLSYQCIRHEVSIKFTKRYDHSVPPIGVISEDLARVFLNLFNNAYYILSEKKKEMGSAFTPELILTTLKSGSVVNIRIRDNGSGIPESLKNKIFTPFFTTKPHGVGTGLGLSISHAIMIELGGTLDVSSKEGEFTEFHMTLPLDK